VPTGCTTATIDLFGAGGGGGGLGNSDPLGTCGGDGGGATDGDATSDGVTGYGKGSMDTMIKRGSTVLARAKVGQGGDGGDGGACVGTTITNAGTTLSTGLTLLAALGSNGGARGTISGTCQATGATAGARGDRVYGKIAVTAGETLVIAVGTTTATGFTQAGSGYDFVCNGGAGTAGKLNISWP
jgi:hypothetical protein